MTTITPIYSTTAHATGDGRNGQVQSDDGLIDLPVLTPTELGGPGGATNPEQLFAAGYAACFHSALRLVARQADIDVTDSAVSATRSEERLVGKECVSQCRSRGVPYD